MIDPQESSITKNPQQCNLYHAGCRPSMILEKMTTQAAEEGLKKCIEGHGESALQGMQVVVTVRLEPIPVEEPAK